MLWKLRKAKKAGQNGIRNLSAGEKRALDVIENPGPGLLGGAAVASSTGLGLLALNQVEEGEEENRQSVIRINKEYGYPNRQEALTQKDFRTPEDFGKYMIKINNNKIMW